MKKIEIYTWTTCPYCIRAKRLLDQKGVKYTEYVIDGDRSALSALKEKTGCGSVPQVFVDGNFVGGCDDIHDLDRQGKFDGLFLEAGGAK